jgi:uncharacterized protein YfdQ (DUF2303 family)
MELEKLASDLAKERIATIDVNGVPVVVVPEGYVVSDLERLCDRPVRLKRAIQLEKIDDLVRYLRLFSREDTRMYARANAARIVAIIDDHDASGDAAWNDHRAIVTLKYSPEFNVWADLASKVAKSQTEFLTVLRDYRHCVNSMEGAELLSLVQDFRATSKAQFRSLNILDDGNFAVEYAQETRGIGKITMPEKIGLFLPVFEGEQSRFLELRVRFEIEEGRLKFFLEIVRKAEIVKEATQEAFGRAEKELATIPMFWIDADV